MPLIPHFQKCFHDVDEADSISSIQSIRRLAAFRGDPNERSGLVLLLLKLLEILGQHCATVAKTHNCRTGRHRLF